MRGRPKKETPPKPPKVEYTCICGCGKPVRKEGGISDGCKPKIRKLIDAGIIKPTSYGICAYSQCKKEFPRYKLIHNSMTQECCCRKCGASKYYEDIANGRRKETPRKKPVNTTGGMKIAKGSTKTDRKKLLDSIPSPTPYEEALYR